MSSGGIGMQRPAHDPRRPRRRVLTILAVVVLLVAGVVGYAHWRVHRLGTADVVWSTPIEHKGALTVAKGNAYSLHDVEGFQVTRLSDGKMLAAEHVGDDVANLYVGRSGWFATVGSYRDPVLTFYSPQGKKMWERTIRATKPNRQRPAAIGNGTITFPDCSGDDCGLISVDRDGTELWKVAGAGRGFLADNGENLEQAEVTSPGFDYMHRLPSIAVVVDKGRMTALDGQGRPRGESIAAKESTVIGDTMIEISREGSQCTYRAVRDGSEVWRSVADCATTGEVSSIVALHDRMYVRYYDKDEGAGDTMVSLNLSNGHAQTLAYAFQQFDNTSLRATYVGPDVVVRQHKERVTGVDPDTGKQLWQRSFDKHPNVTDADASVYPGVEAGDGTVSVLTRYTGFWRWASFARDKPLSLVTLLNPGNGKTSAHLLRKFPYSFVGLGRGKGALVIADDQLFRLKP